MADQKIVPFLFEGEHMVRVLEFRGSHGFVAPDLCRAIGIVNSSSAIGRLDEDEKGVGLIETLGGRQEVAVVTESGLYTLILRSRDATKPGTVAHRFRRWVTSEVLPAIRQTGTYRPEAPALEARDFPEWPLGQMRERREVAALYFRLYGPRSAQWMMPQLGFPVPPPQMIDIGRQADMFEGDGMAVTVQFSGPGGQH